MGPDLHKEAFIADHGTVELDSTCNSTDYVLHLENVLHVHGTQNNLILLGQWDAAGRCYNGGNGQITLITKDGTPVVQGTKILNHLYHMTMVIRPPTQINKIQSHHQK